MIKRANPTVVYHGVNIGSGSYPCNVYMELDANGEFVLYEDHLAAMEEKDKDYGRIFLRQLDVIKEQDKEIERLKAKLSDISICLPINLYEYFFQEEIEKRAKEDSDATIPPQQEEKDN